MKFFKRNSNRKPQVAIVTEMLHVADFPRTYGVDDPEQIKNANLKFIKAEALTEEQDRNHTFSAYIVDVDIREGNNSNSNNRPRQNQRDVSESEIPSPMSNDDDDDDDDDFLQDMSEEIVLPPELSFSDPMIQEALLAQRQWERETQQQRDGDDDSEGGDVDSEGDDVSYYDSISSGREQEEDDYNDYDDDLFSNAGSDDDSESIGEAANDDYLSGEEDDYSAEGISDTDDNSDEYSHGDGYIDCQHAQAEEASVSQNSEDDGYSLDDENDDSRPSATKSFGLEDNYASNDDDDISVDGEGFNARAERCDGYSSVSDRDRYSMDDDYSDGNSRDDRSQFDQDGTIGLDAPSLHDDDRSYDDRSYASSVASGDASSEEDSAELQALRAHAKEEDQELRVVENMRLTLDEGDEIHPFIEEHYQALQERRERRQVL